MSDNDTPKIFIPNDDTGLNAEPFSPENMRPMKNGDSVFIWTETIVGIGKYMGPAEGGGHYVHCWIEPNLREPHTGHSDDGMLRVYLVQDGVIENYGSTSLEDVYKEMKRQEVVRIARHRQQQQAAAIQQQLLDPLGS